MVDRRSVVADLGRCPAAGYSVRRAIVWRTKMELLVSENILEDSLFSKNK